MDKDNRLGNLDPDGGIAEWPEFDINGSPFSIPANRINVGAGHFVVVPAGFKNWNLINVLKVKFGAAPQQAAVIEAPASPIVAAAIEAAASEQPAPVSSEPVTPAEIPVVVDGRPVVSDESPVMIDPSLSADESPAPSSGRRRNS